MKLLSIDSAGKTAAAAVTDGDTLLAQSFTDSGLTHSQTLLPLVDSLLKLAGIRLENIDEFALTCGPGSFTGLRIGAALVMGLSAGRPCRAVSTLHALAYNLVSESGIIIPTMDARRSQVYTAAFESDGHEIKRLSPDEAISVEEVSDRVRAYSESKRVWILGDGAYLFNDTAAVFDNVSFPSGNRLYTQGQSVAMAARYAEPVGAAEIKLSYLRMSQAERELKERQGK